MRHPTRPPQTQWMALPALLLLAGVASAESGSLIKATQLRSEPLGSASVLKELPAKEPVTVTARKGAWAGISTTDGMDGWIRILNLRTGSAEKARSGFGAVASVFATGSSGNDVSTGVKGLNAEQIRHASANWVEVDRLATYVSPDEEAREFAADAELQSQAIAYLPDDAKRSRK